MQLIRLQRVRIVPKMTKVYFYNFSDTLVELRNEPITTEQIVKIKHDVGTCWLDLGIKLKIDPESRVRNLEQDESYNRERAHKVLQMWIDQEGSNATVGRLARVLINMGQKRIAEKLLGM